MKDKILTITRAMIPEIKYLEFDTDDGGLILEFFYDENSDLSVTFALPEPDGNFSYFVIRSPKLRIAGAIENELGIRNLALFLADVNAGNEKPLDTEGLRVA